MANQFEDGISKTRVGDIRIQLQPTKRPIPTDYSNAESPSKRPRLEDQGGLGGAPPPTSVSIDMGDPKRRLRLGRQIKYLLSNRPDIDIFAVSKLDADLARMPLDEMEMVIDNVKQQSGTLNPYAASLTMVRFAGAAIESKFGHAGYAQALAQDVELVAAIDELAPARLGDFGPVLQIVWSMVDAYLNPKTAPTVAPAKKKKINKEKDNGHIPASIPSNDQRQVADGENHMDGGETYYEQSEESSGSYTDIMPDIPYAENV